MTKSSLTTGISSLGVRSSSKISGGGVLIAVKRDFDFDVDVFSTRHGLRIEHECVRVKCRCSEYSYYISTVYLAPDVEKLAYDMFVEDMDAIVGQEVGRFQVT
jgi:hypothetical protein